MRKVIIFSGSYPIDKLGATKTIDINLAEELALIGFDVILVSRGKYESNHITFFSLNSKTLDLLLPLVNRFFSFLHLRLYSQVIINKLFDFKVNLLLKLDRIVIDPNTIFIGRNGMSYSSFRTAKKKGALTILHSQWMHPKTQNELLSKEYAKLGLNLNPIRKKRIKIQLKDIKIVDKIWCISQLVYDSFIFNEVSHSKLFHIPLGVNLKEYQIEEKLDIRYLQRNEKFRVLFVGSVNFEKGAHLLFEALKISSIKDIEVVFNGYLGGEFENIYTKYSELLAKKNLKLILAPGSPKENYLSSSIFVLPSIHESFGLVVLEAMASGLPVVISDAVGAKDCVRDKTDGFIFESKNIEQLKKHLEYLYFNRKEIEILGQNASQNAQNYSWKETSLKFKQLFKEI